jgi:zinc transport system ATP-binding protein
MGNPSVLVGDARNAGSPPDPSATILDVRDLSVAIGGETVVAGVSLTLRVGEVLALLGPNGAGKTMLLRALLGLVPYQGQVQWRAGVRTGYVPQRFSVDRSIPLSVREFLLLKSARFWFPGRERVEHLAHELDLVGLRADVLGKSLGELSGGHLQRILIAWAMLDHPEVLLFDEPTAGIDVGFQETVYNLLRRMQQERGTAILLISHDLNVVYRQADRVLCLNKTMLCYGRPSEVLSSEALARLYGEIGFHQHDHPPLARPATVR